MKWFMASNGRRCRRKQRQLEVWSITRGMFSYAIMLRKAGRRKSRKRSTIRCPIPQSLHSGTVRRTCRRRSAFSISLCPCSFFLLFFFSVLLLPFFSFCVVIELRNRFHQFFGFSLGNSSQQNCRRPAIQSHLFCFLYRGRSLSCLSSGSFRSHSKVIFPSRSFPRSSNFLPTLTISLLPGQSDSLLVHADATKLILGISFKERAIFAQGYRSVLGLRRFVVSCCIYWEGVLR